MFEMGTHMGIKVVLNIVECDNYNYSECLNAYFYIIEQQLLQINRACFS